MKFWQGVVLGAIAGGFLSLLDRQTRTTVLGNCQRATEKVTYFAKHPDEAAHCVTESARKIRSTIEEVGEDISFLTEKVEELRELTPQMVDIVKDTKDVLLEPDEDRE